ncbi:hypothetical protein MASR2M64_10300 [Candidatus Cloacimonadota bacterium]
MLYYFNGIDALVAVNHRKTVIHMIVYFRSLENLIIYVRDFLFITIYVNDNDIAISIVNLYFSRLLTL